MNSNDFKTLWDKNEDYIGDYTSRFYTKYFRHYLKSPILDMGCGNGAFVEELLSKKYDVVGLDTSPKKQFLVKGNICHLPFENENYQTVTSFEVIEHLNDEERQKALQECYRVLKKEGYFILTVPFEEKLKDSDCVCPNCQQIFHRFGHLKSFAIKELNIQLRNTGFKIISAKRRPLTSMARYWFVRPVWYFLDALDSSFVFKQIVFICQK